MTHKHFVRRVLTLLGLVLVTLILARAAHAALDDFTIIVLPDTQNYSNVNPSIYGAQTQWIVDNKEALNIAHVAHVGDIVDNWDEQYQWNNADAAMRLLEDPDGVPYSVLPGNHDKPTTLYNWYFGINRFQGRSYYGDHYPPGSNDNNCTLFSSSGMDFVVISLRMNPSSDVLEWANARLKEYANRRAIVVSHHLLELDATLGAPGLATYGALKDNSNLFLMLCGHRHGEAKRVDLFNGNTIHTLVADYQDRANGGDGWLRILEFSPDNDVIRVSTYSPTLDLFEKDGDSEFELDYDMLTDSDNDGVADQEEWGAAEDNPNYDGNGDGSPDSQQSNVVSLNTFSQQDYITLASPDTAAIKNIEVSESPAADDVAPDVKFPYGFLGFTIDSVGPGDATTLTIYLPPSAKPTTYYKYGPTPSNPINHWYEFLYDGETGAEIDGNVITLHFVDGKRGDDIFQIVDGKIVDQGGPGFDSATSSTGGGGGGGGGGCFIAEAAYELQFVFITLLGFAIVAVVGVWRKFKW